MKEKGKSKSKKVSRVYAAAADTKTISGKITKKDADKIRDYLVKVREDTKAAIVNMRLNQTGTRVPVFVGWVEDKDVETLRTERKEPSPGDFSKGRLGDTVESKEYTDTLAAKGAIVERDWCVSLKQKNPKQRALVPRAGVMYQKLIGIVVQEGNVRRCVGTLNLGFSSKPVQMAEVETMMRAWTQEPSSKGLVEFLKTTFKLGGPTFNV